MMSTNPALGNLLCILGIVLIIGAALWPVFGGRIMRLFSKRKPTPIAEVIGEVPEPDPFQRPELTRDQETSAKAGAIALAGRQFALRVKAYHDLIAENMRLLDEVNSHRRFRGIPELPTNPLPHQ
jgi:hypothetical protein